VSDQLELALADRHAGQEANLAAATNVLGNPVVIVESAVALLARNSQAFTADDVHKLVAHEIPGGYNHNLVSSVMGIWARAGRIIRLPALVPSTVGARKGSRNGTWMGEAVWAKKARAREARS